MNIALEETERLREVHIRSLKNYLERWRKIDALLTPLVYARYRKEDAYTDKKRPMRELVPISQEEARLGQDLEALFQRFSKREDRFRRILEGVLDRFADRCAKEKHLCTQSGNLRTDTVAISAVKRLVKAYMPDVADSVIALHASLFVSNRQRKGKRTYVREWH